MEACTAANACLNLSNEKASEGRSNGYLLNRLEAMNHTFGRHEGAVRGVNEAHVRRMGPRCEESPTHETNTHLIQLFILLADAGKPLPDNGKKRASCGSCTCDESAV